MSAVSGSAVSENFIREKIMVEAIIQLIITAAILYGCMFYSSGTTFAYVLCGLWLLTILGSFRIFSGVVKDVIGYHED
jgi:hypothetical protein